MSNWTTYHAGMIEKTLAGGISNGQISGEMFASITFARADECSIPWCQLAAVLNGTDSDVIRHGLLTESRRLPDGSLGRKLLYEYGCWKGASFKAQSHIASLCTDSEYNLVNSAIWDLEQLTSEGRLNDIDRFKKVFGVAINAMNIAILSSRWSPSEGSLRDGIKAGYELQHVGSRLVEWLTRLSTGVRHDVATVMVGCASGGYFRDEPKYSQLIRELSTLALLKSADALRCAVMSVIGGAESEVQRHFSPALYKHAQELVGSDGMFPAVVHKAVSQLQEAVCREGLRRVFFGQIGNEAGQDLSQFAPLLALDDDFLTQQSITGEGDLIALSTLMPMRHPDELVKQQGKVLIRKRARNMAKAMTF